MNGEIDGERFGIAIGAMCETFGREATDALLEGYWIGLSDLPIERVQEAVALAIRSRKHLPSPAELRELIAGGSTQDRAVAAWGDVLKGIPHGPYRHIDFEDRLINATIRLLGGWPTFIERFSDADSEKWTRLDFLKTYASLAGSGVNGDACRPLTGISKAEAAGGKHEPVPRRIGCDEARRGLPCEVRGTIETRQAPVIARLQGVPS